MAMLTEPPQPGEPTLTPVVSPGQSHCAGALRVCVSATTVRSLVHGHEMKILLLQPRPPPFPGPLLSHKLRFLSCLVLDLRGQQSALLSLLSGMLSNVWSLSGRGSSLLLTC